MNATTNYVALLRGVNAGPKNRIAMPELRHALEGAGLINVETVGQSGNIVLGYKGTAADLERVVRKVLAAQFGLEVDVIVRNEAAIRKLVADNPLRDVASNGRQHFVVFCSQRHNPAHLPHVTPPEQLVARPRELHAWCPNGVQGGTLMTELGRRAPAPITSFRNWNTITKLATTLAARSLAPDDK